MKNTIKKIVFTGAESSGKTTMSQLTAQLLNEPWVKEYAREFLEQTNGYYTQNDLIKIAKGQIINEEKTIKEAKHILICDTDLIVIKVWSEHKYKFCHQYILNQIKQRQYDLYFLCKNDFPWQPDPLRENPQLGDYFFKIYKNELITCGKKFVVLQGSIEQRLNEIKKHTKNLLVSKLYI